MKSHFAMLAGYNRWANGRLYTAVRALSEADYRADRGAFFGSLHGTLTPLRVADRVWMRRFTGTGPVQTRLDEILFEDLPALERARQGEDERSGAYLDGLSETLPTPDDPQPGRRHPAARPGARSLLQSPDPPPRSGPRAGHDGRGEQ